MVPEFVVNGDMELDSDWTQYANPTNARSNEQAHGGIYSRKITHDGAGGYGGILQNITGLTIGVTYSISAWFYNLDLINGERLLISPAGFSATSGQSITPNQGVWTQNGPHIVVADATSGVMTLYTYPTDIAMANKSFYVDGVTITPVFWDSVTINSDMDFSASLSAQNPNWLLIPDNLNWMGEWASTVSYDELDVVLYKTADGEYHGYVSKEDHNTGNVPTTEYQWWTRLIQGEWER